MTPASTTTDTPVPTTTPASTTTDTSRHPSKYEDVFVYTIEERDNQGRSLLHVAYPVTEQEAINERMEGIAEAFIDEFRTVAAEQEAAYQKYLRETGEEAASFATHYVQHFDVAVADADLISVAVEQYRFRGGTTGSTDVTGYLFDREAGVELSLEDLFVEDTYLERLSALSRTELEQALQEEMQEFDFETESAREEWLAGRRSMLEDGTKPDPENFDGILFLEDGTLRIMFDRYQVAPGSEGIVSVDLAANDIADLLVPQMQHLLGVSPEAAATAVPSPTSTPSTTPDGGVQSRVDCTEVACVALTFDDGPSVYTDRLLDVLWSHEVPATFFVLGRSARIQPKTVARMAREGHEIGNHSWSHPNMQDLSDTVIREEICKTNKLVVQISGASPTHFRPPYGAYDEGVIDAARMPIILWSLDTLDWKDRDADLIAERMDQALAGMIILAHDIHDTTVAAIPTVIESLSSRGIHFVTMTDLVGPPGLVPGQVYHHGPAPR
ncbi:MAG: polysaccharide deacetylase family protein [Anaerolineae bacterium]